MKKYLFGLKASKFMKFLLVSFAALSNGYGLMLLGADKEGWDPFILGSIVFLGLSYIASICEKHFKSKMKDLVISLTVQHLIEEYKEKHFPKEKEEDSSEETTEQTVTSEVKHVGQNVVVITIGDNEKTMALSEDKEGLYLTELPKEIEFNGIRVLKENLVIDKVKFSFDIVSNKSIIKSIEKADD